MEMGADGGVSATTGKPEHHAPAEVSIVIPVWDDYVERGLSEALESLQRQDHPAQIIVVDNASHVDLGRHDDLEVVRTSRRVSVGAARNVGLAAARCPWVLFWDADDVMLPGTLAHLLAEVRTDPRVVAVATSIVEGGSGDRHHWPRRSTYWMTRFARLFALVHCVYSLFPTTGSALLRTDAVRDSGGFADTSGGDDWVLGVSLAFRGRVRLTRYLGRLYQRHQTSLSAQWKTKPDIVNHARAVRLRMRQDAGVPAWAQTFTPLVALLQYGVMFVLRPAARRVGGRRSAVAP